MRKIFIHFMSCVMTCVDFFYSSGPVKRPQSQSVAILHFFCGGGGWGLV